MSRALQTLLGTAMIDSQFCELLLNGWRQELLAKFKLMEEERCFLLSVKADSLQGFASEVEQWLSARSHRPTYPGTETDTTSDFVL